MEVGIRMSRGAGAAPVQVSVPWPEAWRGKPALALVLALPVSLLFALGGFALAWVAVRDRDWGGVTLATGVAAFFALATLIGGRSLIWRRRRPAVVTAPEGAGLLFPFGRGLWWGAAGVWIVLAPAMAGTVAVDLADSGGQVTLRTVVAVGVGLLGLFHWFNLATGRMRRGYLMLDAEGITLRTWAHEFRMPWPAKRARAGASPAPAGSGPTLRIRGSADSPTTHRVVAPLLGSAATRHLPDLVTRADVFASDAAVVAHAIAFYRRHPEHRHELTTDAALVRVLEGRAIVARLNPGAL